MRNKNWELAFKFSKLNIRQSSLSISTQEITVYTLEQRTSMNYASAGFYLSIQQAARYLTVQGSELREAALSLQFVALTQTRQA